ncbi:AbrB family transcriptional regulator [Aestuariicoccus sp. KMU-90]|uniref:AbrB family transcriptional regulator n=1 Tax=Thetidibacter halocola TaxID=2827239 RepID=A0A8J8B827_9RHOB|nr:AbrB family transcriptional regulator [Thetidibacter halocola]
MARVDWPVLRRVLLALALGLAGGLLFEWLRAPLPWMLGPMVFNTLAAVLRLPVRGPVLLRPYVVVVIGVMLGAGFTPELFSQVGAWAVSLAFLAVYLVVSGLIVVPYYRHVAGFDKVTAYFSGMPGGLNEMVVLGRDAGGDDGRIALAHAARIVIVVSLVAVWFRLIAGYDLGDRSQFGKSFAVIPWLDLGVLAGCGVLGFFLGRLLRLPAPTLIGPMILSAIAHLTGLSQNPPPSEIVTVAQLFLGTIIGCRFVGAGAGAIGRALLVSLGGTLIMLTITVLFAVVLHGAFGQPTEQVLLAYSPGGLAEMSLVALAMDAEVAYVAIHHVIRITLVVLFAPVVFRMMRNRSDDAE